MANTVKFRSSSVQGAVPTTSQLGLRELAVNTNDGLLFLKRSTDGAETGATTSIVQLFNATGGTITGDVTLNAQADLRFADADSSNWVAFQAPATVASNVTYTLPDSAPTANGQVLASTTAGVMSWTTASGGSGVTDGDKGDITVSSSGATWTIDNDAVTYAKLQNVTSARILGRSTSGSGDVEEISIGSGLSLSSGSLSATASGGIDPVISGMIF